MRGRFGLALCASVSAIGLAGVAHAQAADASTTGTVPITPNSAHPQSGPSTAAPDATTSTGGQEGDIIVTAQKRSERLNDVPLSIVAATGDQLRSAGVTDTSQLVKIVPGFTYQQSTSGTPVYGIRGVSFFDTSGLAQPAVSVYVDQIPLPLSILARGAALDVERVEVLKGPQGTLYGENATGGLVNYIAAKPTDRPTAGFDVTYGRFNQAEFGGFVSAPISGTLGFRLAARAEQRGDWQYSTTRDQRNGSRDFQEARLLLDWKPGAGLRFELNVNGWLDRSDFQTAQFRRFAPGIPNGYAPAIAALSIIPQAPNNARATDWDPGFDLRHDDKFVQTSLRADWDVASGVTLTSLSSYIKFRGKTPGDADGTAYRDVTSTQRDRTDTFSQELRAAIGVGPVQLLAGGYYKYENLREDTTATLGGTNALIAGVVNTGGVYVNHQKVDTYAGFGGAEVALGAGFALQGSVRYTKQNRDFEGCARDSGDGTFALSFGRLATLLSRIPTVIQPGQCVTLSAATGRPAGLVQRSLDEDNVAWRGGLNWKPDGNVLLYANATKGYKSGGFSTLPYAVDAQVNPVRQESVQAYEAGAKLTLASGQVQLNGAGFHYDYRDKQIQGYLLVPPFGNLVALINVPRSRIEGGEVDLTWQSDIGLRVSGSATYIDARVSRSFRTLDPFAASIDIKGERLPATPKWQASSDVQYTFRPVGRWTPYAGASLTYQSSSYSAFGENAEFVLPERALLDLRAGVTGMEGRWRLEAFGRNVTNRYYWVNVSHLIDTVTRFAGMPATYGVTASFRF